jgi:hypothetical protein
VFSKCKRIPKEKREEMRKLIVSFRAIGTQPEKTKGDKFREITGWYLDTHNWFKELRFHPMWVDNFVRKNAVLLRYL